MAILNEFKLKLCFLHSTPQLVYDPSSEYVMHPHLSKIHLFI